MSMRPHGKHVKIDADNPKALALCDYTQMVFNREDLVRQMEWRGNAVVWTGFYVGRPYADKPNEQLRPILLPPDPIPVIEPRLQQSTSETFSNNTLPVWSEINVTWSSIATTEDGYFDLLSNSQKLQNLQSAYFGGI